MSNSLDYLPGETVIQRDARLVQQTRAYADATRPADGLTQDIANMLSGLPSTYPPGEQTPLQTSPVAAGPAPSGFEGILLAAVEAPGTLWNSFVEANQTLYANTQGAVNSVLSAPTEVLDASNRWIGGLFSGFSTAGWIMLVVLLTVVIFGGALLWRASGNLPGLPPIAISAI